jgi:dipeptidase E
MQKIVAIGGGELGSHETLAIDREIVRLAERRHARALFIPTASSDSIEYWEEFRAVYAETLDCTCDVLWLLGDRPAKAAVARAVRDADIVYVGGGNTLKMMRLWRRLGVDRLLTQARKRGAVLCGVSAGANCWFRWSNSDSMKFYHPEDWTWIRVTGLAFLPAACCPHYHGEQREASFTEMIRKHGGVGIALNDNAALQVVGDQCRLLLSQSSGKAWRLVRRRGTVRTELLPGWSARIRLADLLDPAVELESSGRPHR